MAIHVNDEAYRRAIDCLKQGGVLAYPTEGVYGLGCDPNNEQAIKQIILLKERLPQKGFILIAADEEQIKPYIGHVPSEVWERVMAVWPGPITWLLPAAKGLSSLMTGQRDTIAVRITAHPQASELCRQFGAPLISTSANKSRQQPAMNNIEIHQIFGKTVDYVLPGRVGDLKQPTIIKDAMSGKVIRA